MVLLANAGFFGASLVTVSGGNAYAGQGWTTEEEIDKYNFGTGTMSRISGITAITCVGDSIGCSDVSGATAYCCGKYGDATWWKLVFATDVVSTIAANMSQYKNTGSGMGNDDAGWYRNGYTFSPSFVRFNTSEKLTYATGANSAGSTTSWSGNDGRALSNQGANTGYTLGGYTSGGEISTVDKFNLSTDSRSSGPAMGATESGGNACTNSGTAGYTNVAATYTECDKLTYSSDTWSTLSGSLLNAYRAKMNTGTGPSEVGSTGIIGVGSNDASFNLIAFATDTVSVAGVDYGSAQRGNNGFASAWAS